MSQEGMSQGGPQQGYGAYPSIGGAGQGAPVAQPVVVQAQPVVAQAQPAGGQGYRQEYADQDGYARMGDGGDPAVAVPVQPGNGPQIQDGNWPTCLFFCFENFVPSCFMACCCPCFPLARVRASANLMQPEWLGSDYNKNLYVFLFLTVSLTFLGFFQGVVILEVLQIVLSIVFFVLVFLTRSAYRTARGITQNYCCCQDPFFDDCCSSFWCSCCVIAQMDRTEFAYDECDRCGESFTAPV